MKRILLFLLILVSFAEAQETTFKDFLKKGNKGDYIAIEYKKMYSVLSIFEIFEDRIILEEISIPKNKFNKKESFKDWVQNGAKKNSSWMLYEINFKNAKINDAFSITRNAWINFSNNENVLTKLIDLPLKKLTSSERKKIGPRPMRGEKDRRSNWNPTKYFDSKKIKKTNFAAYRTIWPNDDSDLASKIFDLYFDITNSFPLPYWIEINNGNISLMIKTIDSGNNINSLCKNFPRRPPTFSGLTEDKDLVVLTIKSYQQFKKFNLFAVDLSKNEKVIHKIKHTIEKKNGLYVLKIEKSFLNEIFEKSHKYRLIATPQNKRDLFIEKQDLFIWR